MNDKYPDEDQGRRRGHPANHQDDGPPDPSPNDSSSYSPPGDGQYRTPTWHAPFPEKDGPKSDEDVSGPEDRDYGPVERRAFDIQVSSPVDDVAELLQRTHLTAQFHAHNKEYWEQETPYRNDGGMLYDLAILDLAEEKLKLENIDPSELDISERRFNALFLKEARKQNGKELHQHLYGPDPVELAVLTQLGYDGPSEIPSYDTFQRAFRDLDNRDQLDMDAFEAAVTRAVYAVYRAGIVPPDAVKKAYNFDAVKPPLDAKAVSRETEKEELRKWVRELLDRTTGPLTFDRNPEQTKHDMRAFIGALAASALYDCGLDDLKDICDWHYPRENIPGGPWPQNYISKRLHHSEDVTEYHDRPADDPRPVPQIDDQFDAVHTRTLALARQLGFWSDSDSLNVGVDMFRIDWSGDELDATIGRPPKADNEAVTEQWTFLIASVIETESPFVLGGRWLGKLSDYPDDLNEVLSNASETVDMDTIFIDGEIVGGDLIKTLREFVREDWVVSAPDRAVIKALKRLTPTNHVGFARGVKWNIEPKPNVVIYPTEADDPDTIEINLEYVQAEKVKNEREDEHIAFPYESEGAVRRTLRPEHSLPTLDEAFDDPAAQPGIGSESGLAAYLTDRSLPERSAAGIRFEYIQRWSIESTVGQIKNNFMPTLNSDDPNQRLYGLHIAILFHNWHTMINRCLSPGGVPLHVTHQQLLQAILEVTFGEVENDDQIE